MNIDTLLSRFTQVKKTGSGWTALCPAHDDRNPSLSIGTGTNGNTLIHCHAGCDTSAVLSSAGLTLMDLVASTPQPRLNVTATYDYTDEDGTLLFQVVRIHPKTFRQRRPDPDRPGSWIWNLEGVRRVLYRLPDLISHRINGVILVEGEKDADAVAALGFCSTTNPMGGAHWRDDFSQVLLGCNVVVIADKDNSGRKHAQTVAQSLHGYAASIRVLELPDVGGTQVKDAADWISAGGTLAQLDEIISATPAWTPDSSGSTSAGLGCVTNSTHSTNPTNQPITLSNESQDESYLCYLLQLGPLLDRTIPAVRITNPFRELFHLVENLKHWEATHRPATEDEVTGLFNEWFRQSQPFLVETFGSDECRFEFNKVLKRWDPEKRVFRQAWVASEGDPPPPQALKFKDIRIHRLAAFARKLQAQLGDKPLFLSGKVVQKLFGLADRIQGWRWLRMLEGVGVLRLTQSGNTHACNQYRYALPLGLDSNCETILEPPTSRIPIPAPAPDTGVHLAPADQELLIRHQI